MIWFIYIATAMAAYLIGSINTSIILSRALYGEDIRSKGSHNAGATNMLRTHGKMLAAATLVMDTLKGVAAVLGAALLQKLLAGIVNPELYFADLRYIAGFFVVFGHSFPVYFSFRGGKSVATGLGVMLALNWQVGLIVLAVSIIIMAVTRYVSLGSIIGALLFPLLLSVFDLGSGSFSAGASACAAAMGLFIILRHHANISRLIHGEENKLFGGRKDK